MQERGQLVRQDLTEEIRDLEGVLSAALGPFGHDFHVDASDGIGNKTELPWARFCSKEMSPKATDGFYVVLHFSTDGSGVNIAVGCSSSRFHNGYSIVLPPEELAERTEWARRIVREERGSLEPFSDANDFGARLPLPKSFEDASAIVKKIAYDDIEDELVVEHLVDAARMLRMIYAAQRQGRELSGYTIKDTSANKPYDFEAKRGEKKLFVEVKGTTSEAADSIAMTHPEVDLHRSQKGSTALMLVCDIRLQKNRGKPKATGGKLEPLISWDIDEWTLKATAFRVSRQSTD
jgi:hypothetical protein